MSIGISQPAVPAVDLAALLQMIADVDHTPNQELCGYENSPEGFHLMELDEQGRLVFADLDVALGMQGDMPVAYRLSTGEELLESRDFVLTRVPPAETPF